MNEFKFTCPHCEQRLQAAAELAGRQVQCPGCQHLIRIPPPGGGDGKRPAIESGRTWDTFLPSANRK